MSHSTIREVEALVSLSRTQSRLAQEYRQMAAQYADDTYEREHDRLRIESVRHMRSAYRLRDRFYALKDAADEHSTRADVLPEVRSRHAGYAEVTPALLAMRHAQKVRPGVVRQRRGLVGTRPAFVLSGR